MVGNVVRILAGLGGLIAAGWLAVRTTRARKAERAGEPIGNGSTSFLPVYFVLVATALAMVASIPLS